MGCAVRYPLCFCLLLALLFAGSFPVVRFKRHLTIPGLDLLILEATAEMKEQQRVEEAMTPSTPLLVRMLRHAGLYKDKSYAPELKNILLLTACNSGYLEMLTNWECHAKRLGLDWMVMVMDQELDLGERGFLATGRPWKEAVRYNSPVGFKVLTSNKLRTVLEILRTTDLDLVFTDADNVFRSDPFLPSLALGSMLRSGKYEYIYGRHYDSTDFNPRNGKVENLISRYHEEPKYANTGFYFVAGSRKQSIVEKIFENSVDLCDRRQTHDDQENFWASFVVTRRKKTSDKDYVACFRHCDNDNCAGVNESLIFNYCDMNPWENVLGISSPDSAKKSSRMVTYHATHVMGMPAKIGKLKVAGLWTSNCSATAPRRLQVQDVFGYPSSIVLP